MNKQLGRYELRRAIGRGAAGTVWEAWDTTLTRRVAVKVVRPGSTDHDDIAELLARFRQEAQVASCLSHVGVVQVHDYGEVDGEAYIVMEFVEGGTLKTLLDRGERLPVARATEIITGVLVALAECHRRGIVHRDIKPGNIMLPATGGVKLADFGIARTENSELTLVGTVMGTPSYMSPEQFTAREPVDMRSDIWACGVLFYEMLAGTRPFLGPTMPAIGQAVVNDPVVPPSRHVPGLPAALDQVVLRALRKKPAERFPSADAFAEAIRAAGGAGQRRGGVPRRVLAGGGAVLVLLVGGTGAWLWHDAKPSPDPARPTEITRVIAPAPLSNPVPGLGPNVAPNTVPNITPGLAPGVAPASLTILPPPSLAAQVAALRCSTVTVMTGAPQGGATFQGIIGAGAPRAALDAIIARSEQATVSSAVQDFPASDLSCRLAELVRANAGAVSARLAMVGGRTRLVQEEAIRLQLTMPDFDGEVHLEDFDSDGMVSNVMEGNLGFVPRQPAGTVMGLGRNGDTLIGHVDPPYGTDILVAIVASAPLFATPRPPQEGGARFVEDLAAAMAALRRRGGEVAADALVLTTAPK